MSDRWFDGFDDDQLSMIIGCLANRQPLCCENDGRVNRETITKSKKLRDKLDEHAHESWGCLPPAIRADYVARGELDRIESREADLDYYYEKLLEDLQS